MTIQFFKRTHFVGNEKCETCHLAAWEKLETHDCGGYLHSEAYDECSVCGEMIYWDFCDRCGYSEKSHYDHE